MPRAAEPDILVATMPDVRPLASLLKSLSFKSRATLKIDSVGLRMIVEEGRSIQAEAFMQKSCFATYSFNLPLDSPSAFFDETPPPDARDVDSESEQSTQPRQNSDSDDEDDNGEGRRGRRERERERGPPHCEMTVSLSTMLEVLNIFGNAGTQGTSSNPFKRDHGGEDRDETGGGDRGRKRRRDEEEGTRGGGGGGEEKQTSLKLTYKGVGEPLIMMLEESGIVTRCELTAYEPEGLLDLQFSAEQGVQRLIMKSEWLRDALLELPPTSDKLTITFSPPPERDEYDQPDGEGGAGEGEEEQVPLFRLEATGANGSTEMDYGDNPDILEVFECDNPIRNSYKFSHIQLTKHALANSIKTSIRTDDYGLIVFQFMIPLKLKGMKGAGKGGGGGAGGGVDGPTAFVEFKCVALDE
ncbi:uncharacterized protein JCM6883_000891 [Sporobolomyces salmoneus]|uniref:uncharacterized protein n=1 Tax=Sporobolomyces salmoneus TaxID=183962 RepID=UPI003171C871